MVFFYYTTIRRNEKIRESKEEEGKKEI